MRILVIVFILFISLFAEEIILEREGKYKILSSVHLVNAVSYKKDFYQALVEVPAGTTAKWEVNHLSGHIEWEFKKGKPRNVKFIGYPGNYGFIPQTILDKNEGGDGDPLDIIVLGPAVERGSVLGVKILGAIKLLDQGEQDDKIIAISLDSPFSKIDSLSDMMIEYPGVIEIVRFWFQGYKGSKMQFMGYMKRKEAETLIDRAHISWSKHRNDN